MRTIWFHRDYERFTGGHLKHSHYYRHIARMPGFMRRITFTGAAAAGALARERLQLWPPGAIGVASQWAPCKGDVLFLAGVDWRYLSNGGFDGLPNPRINLIQGVRHAEAGTELYEYLAQKAVRICVSPEVASAIRATGRVNGPVLTIPNGIEVLPVDPPLEALGPKNRSVTIVGYKAPALAEAVSAGLTAAGITHLTLTTFCEQREFLALLGRSQVVVCLPYPREGFYLPAIEAMALNCLVVTVDCAGNRSFCRHGENCLVTDRTAEALVAATRQVLGMPTEQQEMLRRQASAMVQEHALDTERQRFHALLGEIDRLWASL